MALIVGRLHLPATEIDIDCAAAGGDRMSPCCALDRRQTQVREQVGTGAHADFRMNQDIQLISADRKRVGAYIGLQTREMLGSGTDAGGDLIVCLAGVVNETFKACRV